MVVALNMYDELEASGAVLDYEHLGAMLGVPMVPCRGQDGGGFGGAARHGDRRLRKSGSPRAPYSYQQRPCRRAGAPAAVTSVCVPTATSCPKLLPAEVFRHEAALERDKEVEAQLADCPHFAEWIALRDRAVPQVEGGVGRRRRNGAGQSEIRFHLGAPQRDLHAGRQGAGADDDIIDAFVTHKLWGFPIFSSSCG